MSESYGLSAIDHQELTVIEKEIHKEYARVEMTARDAMIRMGGLLQDARKLIADDQKFGEWRKGNTPFESKENANKAMLLHRAVQDGIITPKMLESKMGQSHLLELKDAPLSVQTDVEKLLDAGQVPTIKNLRDMKKVASAAAEDKPNGPTRGGPSGIADLVKEEREKLTSPISRTKAERYGDSIGIVEQLLQDILEETTVAHGIANKELNDAQRSQQVNDLRKSIKATLEGVNQMLAFNEERH